MKRTKRRIPVNPHGQASTYAISNLWRVSAITYFSLILLLSAKQTYIVCVSPNVVCVLVTNDPGLPDSPDRSDLAGAASGQGCIKLSVKGLPFR